MSSWLTPAELDREKLRWRRVVMFSGGALAHGRLRAALRTNAVVRAMREYAEVGR